MISDVASYMAKLLEIQNTTTTPPHFWRNFAKTWRTTNTGMNPYTLHTYIPLKERKLYQSKIDGKTLNPKENKKLKFFVEEINDCLGDIYMGKEGFVFTKEQVNEVKKLIPSIHIKRSCKYGCYCCWM